MWNSRRCKNCACLSRFSRPPSRKFFGLSNSNHPRFQQGRTIINSTYTISMYIINNIWEIMGILVVDISWFQTWYQTWYQHFSTFSKPDLLNTTQEQHSSAPRLNTHHGPCGQDPPVPRARQSLKSSERRRSRRFFSSCQSGRCLKMLG